MFLACLSSTPRRVAKVSGNASVFILYSLAGPTPARDSTREKHTRKHEKHEITKKNIFFVFRAFVDSRLRRWDRRYSASAMMGSIRVARRAGSAHARIATAARTIVTVASTSGSVALTPNN